MAAAGTLTNRESAPSRAPSLFRAMAHGWWIVASITFVAALLGYSFSSLQPTRYSASARVLLDDAAQTRLFGGDSTVKRDPARVLNNEAERIRSPEVMARSAAKLGGGITSLEVARAVKASAAIDIDQLTLTATAPDPEEAARIANQVVASYGELVVEQRTAELTKSRDQLTAYSQRIQQQIDADNTALVQIQLNVAAAVRAELGRFALQSTVDAEAARRYQNDPSAQQIKARVQVANTNQSAVNTEIEQQNIAMSLLNSGVSVFRPAAVPTAPSSPKPARDAALALVLGLLAGSGLAWWRADRQAPVDMRGVNAQLGVPQLGVLPAAPGLFNQHPVDLRPESPLSAVARVISAGIDHQLRGEGELLLVTSLRGREGRTLTAVSTAVAAGRGGRRVIIVDCDPSNRGLTRLAGAEGLPGLSDVLAGTARARDVLRRFPLDGAASVFVMPAGHALIDPVELSSDAALAAMRQLSEEASLVLIDGPPLLTSGEAVDLASRVDAVLLVVTRDASADDLTDAQNRLDLVGATLLGFVSNAQSHATKGLPQIRDLRLGAQAALLPGRIAEEPDPQPTPAPAAEATPEVFVMPSSSTPAPVAAPSTNGGSPEVVVSGNGGTPADHHPEPARKAATLMGLVLKPERSPD